MHYSAFKRGRHAINRRPTSVWISGYRATVASKIRCEHWRHISCQKQFLSQGGTASSLAIGQAQPAPHVLIAQVVELLPKCRGVQLGPD